MIGLDTNVIVRYLLRDDPSQSARVDALIAERMSSSRSGFVSVPVLLETVWVLDSFYGQSRDAIARAIEQILATREFLVEAEEHVFAAMIALKDGSGSFEDSLIGEVSRAAGCSTTYTFDRQASRLDTFTLLSNENGPGIAAGSV